MTHGVKVGKIYNWEIQVNEKSQLVKINVYMEKILT